VYALGIPLAFCAQRKAPEEREPAGALVSRDALKEKEENLRCRYIITL